MKSITEEGVTISSYGDAISKELDVFYNPVMKLNRDMSLLVIASYFDKKVVYCDPMAATGIRQLRFLKTIPDSFDKLYTGDISKKALSDLKKNFKKNKTSTKKLILNQGHALQTLAMNYFDCIEVDPFGSPVPFLDLAVQRIKHRGILSVTATDTAALCGTYPRTCLRRYGIKVEKTLWLEELGLRNLIAYCQRQAAKYDKALTPIVSFTSDHYYKIFFISEDGRGKALEKVKELKYIAWDSKTQKTQVKDYESKGTLGKTYVGPLWDLTFIEKMQSNLNLLEDSKRAEKLLNSLSEELQLLGYINPHKLQKSYKFHSSVQYEELFNELKKKKYKVSKVHNNRYGIKTNASAKTMISIMKRYP